MRGQMTHLDTDVLAEFRAGADHRAARRQDRRAPGWLRSLHRPGRQARRGLGAARVGPGAAHARQRGPAARGRARRRGEPETGIIPNGPRPTARVNPVRMTGRRPPPGFRLAAWRVLVPPRAVVAAGRGRLRPEPRWSAARGARRPPPRRRAAPRAREQRRPGSASSAAVNGRARPRRRRRLGRVGAAGDVTGLPPPARRDQPDRLSVSGHPQAAGRNELTATPAGARTRRRVRAQTMRVRAGPWPAAPPWSWSRAPASRASRPPSSSRATGTGDTAWVAGPGCSAASRDVARHDNAAAGNLRALVSVHWSASQMRG